MNAKRLYNILIIKVIRGGKSTPIDSSLCHSCHYSSEDSFRYRLSNSFRTLLPLLLLLTSCETIELNDHSLVTFDGATYVVCHHLTYAPPKDILPRLARHNTHNRRHRDHQRPLAAVVGSYLV